MTRLRAWSLDELAEVLRQPRGRLRSILEVEVERGMLMLDADGRYRLTDEAERRHGRDLRGIGDEP